MKDQKNAVDSFMTFAHKVGAHTELVSDHANLLICQKSDYAKKARFLNLKQTSCEPNTQGQNEFGGEIRLLKRRWKNRMATNNCLVQV